MSDALTLEDAAFLVQIAKGFEHVVIRPKGKAAAAIRDADEGTKYFKDRAMRLREIARRIRAQEMP